MSAVARQPAKYLDLSDLSDEELAAREAIKRNWQTEERIARWKGLPWFTRPPWEEFGDKDSHEQPLSDL